MKKLITLSAVGLIAVTVMIGSAKADLDFVVNAMPATVLVDTDGDKFEATGADGRISLSQVYYMPNIAAGIGADFNNLYFDLLGGGGIVINDGFRSFMLQLLLEGTYEFSNALNIGPRVGLVHFPDPEWLENDDLDFDSDTGFLVGLMLEMGDKIKYLVSIDVIDVSFNVDDRAPGVMSDDKFDLTGLAFQFGVRGEF